MKVVCPQCNSSYTVAKRNMPKKRAVAMCKKCGSKILIEPAMPGAVRHLVASEMASDNAPHPTTAPDPSGSAGKGIFVDYLELQGLSSERFDL
ncbi:MAG: zinc-ribbon domain-containing protein [Deltaproteobacteria bacterium]|nr:zinc-ribbon domain-containing protein [Deltaproteobacteria bacterium]MBW2338752.1 zinc-ribbon domain-containing protein [Deltaproteobacteria bacterium]